MANSDSTTPYAVSTPLPAPEKTNAKTYTRPSTVEMTRPLGRATYTIRANTNHTSANTTPLATVNQYA